MRKSALFLALILAGCGSKTEMASNVKVEYIHKYGIPVNKSDWDKRGRDGQVRSLKEDGVTVTQTFRQGRLDGETTYTLPHSDTIAKKELYQDGELFEVTEYFSSGMPKSERRFLPGGVEKRTSWYSTGTPQLVEAYRHHKLIAGEYYDLSNTVATTVDDGNGTRHRWDPYGDLIAADTIENGKMVASTEFHPNGTPAVINPYREGKVHGKRRTYHPDGSPATVESWQYGVQHGLTTVFQNGERFAEVAYVDGEKHGTETRFRGGNQPVEQVTWTKGHRHGPSRTLVEGESLTKWYFRDKEVSRAVFDRLTGSHG